MPIPPKRTYSIARKPVNISEASLNTLVDMPLLPDQRRDYSSSNSSNNSKLDIPLKDLPRKPDLTKSVEQEDIDYLLQDDQVLGTPFISLAKSINVQDVDQMTLPQVYDWFEVHNQLTAITNQIEKLDQQLIREQKYQDAARQLTRLYKGSPEEKDKAKQAFQVSLQKTSQIQAEMLNKYKLKHQLDATIWLPINTHWLRGYVHMKQLCQKQQVELDRFRTVVSPNKSLSCNDLMKDDRVRLLCYSLLSRNDV